MISLDSALRDECYVSTYSGRHLDLLTPDPSQIDIEDIVHGLAYQPCFNGQSNCFYSLAQHSLLVAGLVPLQQRLAALLHDAVAAYFGDMVRSMRQLMPEFSAIETRIMGAISERFAVSGFDAPAIKRAHLVAQATEQRDVRPHSAEPDVAQGWSVPIPRRLELMSPEEAKDQFMALFTELTGKAAPWKSLPTGCRGSERQLPADPSGSFGRLTDESGEVVFLAKNGRDRQMLAAIYGSTRKNGVHPS